MKCCARTPYCLVAQEASDEIRQAAKGKRKWEKNEHNIAVAQPKRQLERKYDSLEAGTSIPCTPARAQAMHTHPFLLQETVSD
eukprot:637869-Pelagomonas_calceolata.AAC.5